MKDFYVEVISNGSFDTNTLTEFRNKVQLMYPLEGQWEVGISEISYTKSWYNLYHNSTLALVAGKVFNPEHNHNAHDFVAFDKRSGTIKRGFYETPQILVDEINKELEFYKDDKIVTMPKLFYDATATKQVYIIVGRNKHRQMVLPYLDPDLQMLLGFDSYDISHAEITKQAVVLPKRPADLTMGIRQLLVYCSLVMPQYVGDSRTKLLRCVEIPSETKFGDQVTLSYDKPHYIPLLYNDFEEIEINIKDDMGQPIRFMSGRTRVKLHFKRNEL